MFLFLLQKPGANQEKGLCRLDRPHDWLCNRLYDSCTAYLVASLNPFFFSFAFIQERFNILKSECIRNFSVKEETKKENDFELLLKS